MFEKYFRVSPYMYEEDDVIRNASSDKCNQ